MTFLLRPYDDLPASLLRVSVETDRLFERSAGEGRRARGAVRPSHRPRVCLAYRDPSLPFDPRLESLLRDRIRDRYGLASGARGLGLRVQFQVGAAAPDIHPHGVATRHVAGDFEPL